MPPARSGTRSATGRHRRPRPRPQVQWCRPSLSGAPPRPVTTGLRLLAAGALIVLVLVIAVLILLSL